MNRRSPARASPLTRLPADRVSAGTMNRSRLYPLPRRRGVGEDTTLSQIIRMVSDAAATKAPIAKVADKRLGRVCAGGHRRSLLDNRCRHGCIAGETVGFALARGISVLVISCPCALGLGNSGRDYGRKRRRRKERRFCSRPRRRLSQTGKTQIVALDKTGTVTRRRSRASRTSYPADG